MLFHEIIFILQSCACAKVKVGGALHCPCLVMDSGYEKLVSDSFMLKEELKYELVVQLMGTLPVGANILKTILL